MNKAKNSPQPKVFSPRYLSCGGLVTGLSLFLVGTNSLMAQVDDELNDDILLLDPFEVTTNIEGYKALDTLGGARVRTTLADTASSLSVVTPKLMQDLGVTDAEDLLIYTTNTEVSGLGGNFSGMPTRGLGVASGAEDQRLFNPSGTNRSRGLSAMDNTRNYFQSEIPWDGYNISRIDISRGPNSFLFGVGSPSGISNVTTNEAAYRDFGNVEFHYGSYGSTRESLDYNEEIINNELAVRVNAVNDRKKFKQDPAFNNSQRGYLALRYDPSFLDTKSSHTKILFNYEYGNVESNNPRTMPPLDYISGYFADGINQDGYNMFTFDPDGSQSDPTTSPWASNASINVAFDGVPTYWFDSSSGQIIMASTANPSSDLVDTDNGDPNPYNIYTSGYRHYATAVNYLQRAATGNDVHNETQFYGAALGSVNYLDKTLTDPTVFDFFNNLIDGDNKREWQDWDAYNLSIVQSFFDNRLSFQAIATYEDYLRGMEGPLSGYNSPFISVDLNAYLPRYNPEDPDSGTAEANPNVGRPFIGGMYNGGNNSVRIVNENYQLTASYSFKAEDITTNDNLINILGHQEFTALVGHYVKKTETREWDMYSVDRMYSDLMENDPTLAYTGPSWVSYLGDSFQGADSASGAYLDSLSNLTPGGSMIVWQNESYNSIDLPVYSSANDRTDFYSQGTKSKETLDSQAFLYQGFFLDGAVIPSFGWRRDRMRQQGANATLDDRRVASLNYEIEEDGDILTSTSTSYGLAVHLGKIFKGLLPENDDISVYYFHGNNQRPNIRYSADGNTIPQEEGVTDDYSIQYDGFDNRVTLRLTYFKTIDNYAAASYGQPLGAGGWLLDSLPMLTLGFYGNAMRAIDTYDATGEWNYWPSSGMLDWYTSENAEERAIVDNITSIMQNQFVELFPQNFWDMYGMGQDVNVADIVAGNWANIPDAWAVNNSHMIHGTYPIIDQNLESKGFELEATIRPLSNWDITFNASRVESTQTALGEGISNYLTVLADLYVNTDLGRIGNWGGWLETENQRNQFITNLWGPYLTQVALTGSDQPELRKWNFRIISNYTFNEGALKGINVGGAYRWADKPILGYGVSMGEMFEEDAWMFDVNKPFYGSTDSHFDMWIGYQRELTEKIDWRIQLNLRNVGESADLVTIAVEPDGSVAQQRITEGMTYDLSMKFMF